MLNASSRTLLGVAVAAAATTGSADENDISLAKTGATKCVEKQSNDEMSARTTMGLKENGFLTVHRKTKKNYPEKEKLLTVHSIYYLRTKIWRREAL